MKKKKKMVKKKKKRTISQAEKNRLKALRKKHKLGEFAPKGKAFSKKRVSTGVRRKSKPLNRSRTITKTMARRRVKRRTSRKGMFSNPRVKEIIGATAWAVVGEPATDMVASRLGLNIQDDFVKLGVGLAAQSKRMPPIVKGMGKAATILAVSNIAKNRLGNLMGSLTSNTATSSSSNGW